MAEQQPDSQEGANEKTLADIHREMDALTGVENGDPFKIIEGLFSREGKSEEQISADMDKARKLHELTGEWIEKLTEYYERFK